MAKLNTKTIVLTGTEQAVKLSGQNCDVQNDSVSVVYVSAEPGIVAGADGVLAVAAGHAVQARDFGGTIYLLGTGSVQVCGHDYQTPVFKGAATSSGEGGGTDDVARQAISSHAGNAEIHVTAEERESWNGKTTLAESAEVFSNPNLLINPDFSINQRGQTEYVNGKFAQYTVDGWFLREWNTTATVSETGLIISANNDGVSGTCLEQYLSEGQIMYGEPYTLSVKSNDVIYVATGIINSVSDKIAYRKNNLYFQLAYDTSKSAWCVRLLEEAANSLALKWAQLEPGTIPTRHVKSHPATELVKCQRYYEPVAISAGTPIFAIATNKLRFSVNFKVPKRVTPTFTGANIKICRTDNSSVFGDSNPNIIPTASAINENGITFLITNEQVNPLTAGEVGYISDGVLGYVSAEL